ncbi:hypothetical protein ACVWXO_001473 [Bradyrhizobium sp. LM2.7]
MVRLGFIIGFIALLGALLSGLAAYRVHDQELALDRIALARAIDVHASLVQDRLTERELLARVASGLFRAPSVIKPNMLEPLRSAIYAFKTDFVVAGWVARLKPTELAAAQTAIAGAGFPNSRIRTYDDKPIDPASVTWPIDVLMDLEPRSDETKTLPGRSYDQDQVRKRDADACPRGEAVGCLRSGCSAAWEWSDWRHRGGSRDSRGRGGAGRLHHLFL